MPEIRGVAVPGPSVQGQDEAVLVPAGLHRG